MNTHNLLILLQTAPAGEQPSPWTSFIPLILIILVFYFLMIRPQMKKQKALKQYQDNLQPGAHVLTSGGIHGKVVSVGETTVDVEIATGVKITVEKFYIVQEGTPQQQK